MVLITVKCSIMCYCLFYILTIEFLKFVVAFEKKEMK